jgi:hypothetical protein
MVKGWDSSSSSSSEDESSDKKRKPAPKRSKSLENLKPHQKKAALRNQAKAKTIQYDERGKPVPRKLTAEELANSSILRDESVPAVPTIVGDISGWLPCDDNLPNHPTMVTFTFFVGAP